MHEMTSALQELLSDHPDIPLEWRLRSPADGGPSDRLTVEGARRGPLGEMETVGAFRVDRDAARWLVTPERSPEGDLIRTAARVVVDMRHPTADLPPDEAFRFHVVGFHPSADDVLSGEYTLTSSREGDPPIVVHGIPAETGDMWHFEMTRDGSEQSTWFETSLSRVRDEALDLDYYAFWSIYNGIGDDSRVLAHASLFDAADLIWHHHPALKPDSSSDHGEALLCLADHLATALRA